MKKALITGVTGQDGAYLAKFLLQKGYEVYGVYRRLSTPNFWRLEHLGIFDKVNLIPADMIDGNSVIESVRISEPDEIYHLAAQSFVGASFEQPVGACEITGLGTVRILEAIRDINPRIRFYQASTSELYGTVEDDIQDENTPFHPASPYAAAKLYAYWTTRIYREGYGLFACNGILFNHESPIRGLEFVTRKITNAVAKIHLGMMDKLHIGNITTYRDWGFAPDYVESMWLMLQHERSDDYVIATGETHSVEEFLSIAFETAGMDWKDYVSVDERHMRPIDVKHLCGDSSKAQKELKWEPKVRFGQLVRMMVTEDISRWVAWSEGRGAYWDALSYPGDGSILTRALRM